MGELIGLAITVLLFLAAVIGWFIRETHWKTKLKDTQEAKDTELDKKIDERDAERKATIKALENTVKLELSHVNDGLTRVENILGNGHGLINDVRDLAKAVAVNAACTEGKITDIYTRLSAQQHEIDDLKGEKK